MFSTINQSSPSPESERLNELLKEIAAGNRSSALVAQFSDLTRSAAFGLSRTWRRLPLEGRRYLVRQMRDLAETNLELDFRRILRVAMTDDDPEVRVLAISGLWEDESTEVLDRLLAAADTESDSAVREACAVALGRFALKAATDDLDEVRGAHLRRVLLAMARDGTDIAVRRRALESLSYLPDDAEVLSLISDAYSSPYHDLRVSAVFSMGRSLDRRWFSTVLSEMMSDDPEFRFEAARAAGEFGDQRAVEPLLSLLEDDDREVQTAAIGALGQIGGRVAVNALRRLTNVEDPGLREAADEALVQASYADDPLRPETK